MVEAAQVATQPLDFTTLATNVGILIGFVVAAVLGLKKGLETFKKSGDTEIAKGRSHIAAAQLLENQTLRDWSDSNNEVAAAMRGMTEELHHTRRALYEHGGEVKELRHQIERVRDKM